MATDQELQQVRRRVQESRRQLEERLKESREARKRLEQARKKLPERVSQTPLMRLLSRQRPPIQKTPVGKATREPIQRKKPIMRIGIPLGTPMLDALKKGLGEENIFRVFGRRFGQDIQIGEGEAKEKLKSFLKKTLGRSGQIKKGGEALEFKNLGFGNEFRSAKKDITRIVQKAKFSLGTGSEVLEIQRARKGSNNPKRRKSINWFG